MPEFDWDWWDSLSPEERYNREHKLEKAIDRKVFKRIAQSEEDEED